MEKKITKKEVLKSPVREWGDTDKEYSRIWLVPAGTKHDSGYMHIAVVGVRVIDKKEVYEICGYPDDISCFFPSLDLQGLRKNYPLVRMDCIYPTGILQYHGDGKFKVSEALSSVDITFIPNSKF